MKAKNPMPLDEDGYPDDEAVSTIKAWDYHDPPRYADLMAYIREHWWSPEFGWRQDGLKYQLSTGGWSGNEELVSAMQANYIFWSMCWESSRRGGHYEFELPKRMA